MKLKNLSKKQKYVLGILLFFLAEFLLAFFVVEVEMTEKLDVAPELSHRIGDISIPWTGTFRHAEDMRLEEILPESIAQVEIKLWILKGISSGIVLNTWLVMALLVVCALCTTRRLKPVPTKVQRLVEFIVEFFDTMCRESLGEQGRKYLPLIGGLFLFVWISNVIGIIPIPYLEEPTRNINTTLGLGILCFIISHGAAIRAKGISKYLKDYCNPYIIMLPLNIVGEFGKVLSHSFRLWGNIMGGAILMIIASKFVHYWALPIGLHIFFGLFVGTVQAFVFSILALTYITVLVTE